MKSSDVITVIPADGNGFEIKLNSGGVLVGAFREFGGYFGFETPGISLFGSTLLRAVADELDALNEAKANGVNLFP